MVNLNPIEFFTDFFTDPYDFIPNIFTTPYLISYKYNDLVFKGFMGNYWSSYFGFDSNNDGIGDTSFIRQCKSVEVIVDNYPLIKELHFYDILSELPTDPLIQNRASSDCGLSSQPLLQ